MKLKRLRRQIEIVLKEEPYTRDSDIALTIRVWQRFYKVRGTIKLDQLYDLPREDNVKRIRAKFCQRRKPWAYPTKLEIAKKRFINEEEWRQMLSYPAGTETIYPTREMSYLEQRFPLFRKD